MLMKAPSEPPANWRIVEQEEQHLAEGERHHDEVDAARAQRQRADRQRGERRRRATASGNVSHSEAGSYFGDASAST